MAVEYGLEDLPDEGLSAVATGAAALKLALKEKAQLEEDMKLLNARILKIETEELPGAMKALGVESLTLASGEVLTVREEVNAGIPAARMEEALEWVRRTGNASLIKRSVTVSFGRDEDARAEAFVDRVIEELPENELLDKVTINPQTLKAFVRERVELEKLLAAHARGERADEDAPELSPEARVPLPRDVFGVFILNRAVLKKPKK